MSLGLQKPVFLENTDTSSVFLLVMTEALLTLNHVNLLCLSSVKMKGPAGPLVHLPSFCPTDLNRECKIVRILVPKNLCELLLASLFISTFKWSSFSQILYCASN